MKTNTNGQVDENMCRVNIKKFVKEALKTTRTMEMAEKYRQ